MTTIYVLRHGKTELNKKSVIMGQIDSPLTNEGREMAIDLAKKLENITFETIYSSDLGRAFMTATLLSKKLNHSSPIVDTPELREINYGVWGNKPKKQVKSECPEYKTDPNFVFPEGESFAQVQKRVVTYLLSLSKIHSNKNILLVTHAGCIRALKAFFTNLNYRDYLDMHISHNYIGRYEIDDQKLISYHEIQN